MMDASLFSQKYIALSHGRPNYFQMPIVNGSYHDALPFFPTLILDQRRRAEFYFGFQTYMATSPVGDSRHFVNKQNRSPNVGATALGVLFCSHFVWICCRNRIIYLTGFTLPIYEPESGGK